jgi:hypothetical protein
MFIHVNLNLVYIQVFFCFSIDVDVPLIDQMPDTRHVLADLVLWVTKQKMQLHMLRGVLIF